MPETVNESVPRRATRTTILKDEVPAPPLPPQTSLPGMEPPKTEEGWPRGAEDALDYLRLLKPADWDNHEVYLYWTRPGERKLIQIEKVNEGITRDWIQKKFGGSAGGFFTIWVNYLGDPRWHKTTQIELEGQRIFIGQPVPPQNAGVSPNGSSTLEKMLETLLARLTNLDPNAQGAIDMLKNTFNTALETVSRAPALAPANAPTSLLDTIRALKELGLISQPQAGSNLLDTIKTLKELGLIGSAIAASDPVKLIEGLGKAIAAMKEVAGIETDGADWKAMLVKGGIEFLPHLRGMTQDIARAAELNARAQPLQRPAPPNSPVRTSTTTPPQESPQAQPAANPAPATPATAPTEPPPDHDMSDWVWDRIAVMIATGEDGDNIAQWLNYTTFDPQTKRSELIENLAKFTEHGLLVTMQSKENIRIALEGKDANLLARQFLHFCRTGEMWESEEETETAEVPPAA